MSITYRIKGIVTKYINFTLNSIQQNKDDVNQYIKINLTQNDLSSIIQFTNCDLDIFLRYIHENASLFYSDYVSNWHSILLEQIIIEHKNTCLLENCFCNKGDKIEDEGKEFLGDEIRKRYIQEYILKNYRKELQKKQQSISSNILGFYCYLIDIVRNDKQIQLEFIKFKNTLSLIQSVKGKQIFYVLNQFAHSQSLNFNILNNPNGRESQSPSNIYKQQQVELYEIFLFDKYLDETFIQFQETLKQKENILTLLGKDFVDLQELFKACKIFMKLKKELIKNIVLLIKQNKSNYHLLTLCEQYQNSIDFDSKLQSQFNKIQNSQDVFKEKLFNDPDSFIVFISIFKKDNEIIQVSSNFEKIFPKYTNKNIIGKDLNFILPQKFQEPHKRMLREYSEKSLFSKKIKRFPLQLGIDSNGWALPLEIKIQNHQIGNDDMGICAWMRKIKQSDKHYISLQYNKKLDLYEILTLSSSFYEIVFQSPATNGIKFNKINVNHFCPVIQEYLNQNKFEQKFETLIFKPQMIDKNTTSQLNLNELNFQDQFLFFGEFVMYKYQNSNVNIVSIEISSLQQVQSNIMKKEAMEILKNQLSFNEIKEGSVMKSQNEDEFQIFKNRTSSISNNNLFYQMKTSSRILQNEKTAESPIDFTNLHVKIQPQQMKSQHSLLKYTTKKQLIPYSTTIQEQVETETPLSPHKRFIQANDNRSFGTFDSPRIKAQDSPQVYSIDSPRRFSAIQEQEALTLALSPSNSQQQSFNFLNKKQVNQSLDNLGEQYLQSVTSRKSYKGQSTSKQVMSDIITAETDQKQLVKSLSPSTLTLPLQNNRQGQLQKQIIQNIQSSIFSSNKQVEAENPNIKQAKKAKRTASQVNTSSQSKTSNQTNVIIHHLKSEQKIFSFRVINLVGLTSVFIVFMMSIINYINLENFLLTYQQSFTFLNWSSSARIKMSSIFSNFYVTTLVSTNLYQINDPVLKQKFISDAYSQIAEDVNNFGKQVEQMAIEDQNVVLLFRELFKEKIIFQDATYNPMFPDPISFGYAMIMESAHLKMVYDRKTMNIGSLYVSHNNYDGFASALQDVQAKVHSIFDDQMNSQTKVHLQVLIYVFVVDFLFCTSILIIYSVIQSKREKILKLLTTFSPDQLKKMILKINVILSKTTLKARNKANYSFSQFNNNKDIEMSYDVLASKQINPSEFSLISASNKIQKKRNFSTTSNLQRFSIKLFLICFLFLVLLQFYSISIYILLEYFQKITSDNQDFMNTLLETQYLAQHSLGYNYIAIVAKMVPTILINPLTFIEKANKLYTDNVQMLNKMYEYKQIYSSYTRLSQESYDTYLVAAIEGKTCEIINDYTEYQLKVPQFKYNLCKEVKNQIFDKGILATLKYLMNIQKQVLDMVNSPKMTDMISQFSNFKNQFSIFELDDLDEVVNTVFTHLVHFLETMTKEMILYMKLIHIILVICQTALTISVVYFGWYKFYENIQKQIIECKQMLGIIDLDYLLENTHVISYVKSNKL